MGIGIRERNGIELKWKADPSTPEDLYTLATQ